MNRIKGVKRLTENRFLNLYELDARQRDGKAITYYVASRAKSIDRLKAVEGHRRADGVIMYGVYGENKDKIVLIRQYRYPLGTISTSSPRDWWSPARTSGRVPSGRCSRRRV